MSRYLNFSIFWCFGLVAACLLPAHGFSAETGRLQRITASQNLRVCIWPDYYGITYRNPQTQQLSGIDIDNAKELAKDLGVKLQFVNSSFATLITDLEADACDIAMFAIGITPERQQKLRFTRAYMASDVYGITTISNRTIKTWTDIDKPNSVVVVAKGTLHEAVMKAKLTQAELRVVDSARAREEEVQSGRADVFMTDYPYSRRMLHKSDWARLVSPPSTYHITPYAWAMKPGDDAFHERIEQFLESIKKDGRLLTHAKRYELEPIVEK